MWTCADNGYFKRFVSFFFIKPYCIIGFVLQKDNKTPQLMIFKISSIKIYLLNNSLIY